MSLTSLQEATKVNRAKRLSVLTLSFGISSIGLFMFLLVVYGQNASTNRYEIASRPYDVCTRFFKSYFLFLKYELHKIITTPFQGIDASA